MIDDATIENIIVELRPLKRGTKIADVRQGIRDAFTDLEPRKAIASPAQVKKWAGAATRILAIADKVGFPLQDRSQLEHFRAIYLAARKIGKIPGPDARYNNLAWHCGFQACLLVERFSENEAVQTQNGNVHNIARLFYCLISGDRPGKKMSEEALLWAIRQIVRSRR